jgi:hypothetical protein
MKATESPPFGKVSNSSVDVMPIKGAPVEGVAAKTGAATNPKANTPKSAKSDGKASVFFTDRLCGLLFPHEIDAE